MVCKPWIQHKEQPIFIRTILRFPFLERNTHTHIGIFYFNNEFRHLNFTIEMNILKQFIGDRSLQYKLYVYTYKHHYLSTCANQFLKTKLHVIYFVRYPLTNNVISMWKFWNKQQTCIILLEVMCAVGIIN